MTAPLTLDQIEDAEEFVLALEHWRRISEPALDDVERGAHERSVALVRLAFAELRVRSAAPQMLEALEPFAALVDDYEHHKGPTEDDIIMAGRITRRPDEGSPPRVLWADYRRARAAISRATGGRS